MKELFNQQFKFQINDSVRHKGDSHKFDSDMGLLIIERHLIESLDANDNVVYEKSYVCRMIRWSGSGDIARFHERELMTVSEHEEEKIKRMEETNQMRTQVRMVEKEVLEVFGISKENYLHEIVNGQPDKSKKFRMTGFDVRENEIKLLVRESLFTAASRKDEENKIEPEKREWTSKDQFVKAE